MNFPIIAEALNQIVKVANNSIEKLVHQFWLYHLRDIDYDPFSCASHPSCFSVSTSATGENKDASISGIKSI